MVFVGRRTWCVGFLRLIHLQRCLFIHLSRAKLHESDPGLWMRRSPGHQGYRVPPYWWGRQGHAALTGSQVKMMSQAQTTLGFFFSFLVSVVELRAWQAFKH